MKKPDYVYVTYIATTPEKLWQALTDLNPARAWWVDPKAGCPHSARSDWLPGSAWKLAAEDGSGELHVIGKVLETTPPSRLVLSWAKPGNEADPGKYSRATFDIEPYGEGLVRLTVTHDELDEAMFTGISSGWPKVLSNLKTFLETGRALAERSP